MCSSSIASTPVKPQPKRHDPEIGWAVALLTYLSYAMLIAYGHIRDFFANLTGISRYAPKSSNKGFAVLLKSWESFFTRRLYHRIQDCWGRPIASAPAAHIRVMLRESKDENCTLHVTPQTLDCLNLGSYNYLGFADDWHVSCKKEVLSALEQWPVSMSASRAEAGSTRLHEELEETVARFVGKEAAVVYTMGYNTNTSTLPALLAPGTLLVSDALNHTSIVNGARASQASIRVFKHNDARDLEMILREAVVHGQPRHHRPWRKILVVVEGIYSMEGAICNLKDIVAVCKKYKAFIYVDEAHSIGALGASGRGVCEYAGVDPADIDVLMGTFTKSFSGMGGYIAGSRALVEHLKSASPGLVFHNAMSPVLCAQILTAFRVIMGEDGTDIGRLKIQQLRDNSNFFREQMVQLGLHVYGDFDSPIVPVLIYFPAKVAAFSRECLKRGVAVVVVGFPATSVILSRARFCLSAGLTRQDLEHAVRVIGEVADLICLKYNNNFIGA